MPEYIQIGNAGVGFEYNITSTPSISTIGSTERNKLFPTETHHPTPPITGPHRDFNSIEHFTPT
jgi:hypothetical protein